MRGTAIVSSLWNDIKSFHIAEIHVGRPHGMEDQPDLGKIKAL